MKAILFDFDGVLGRTMEDNFGAWQKAMAGFGVEIEPDDYFPLEGLSLKEVAKRMALPRFLNEEELQQIVQKKDEYYLSSNKFEFYSGVEELLKLLKSKNVPVALVTAARLERLKKSLPVWFWDMFGFVVTSENGGRGKPYPDPYLSGAEGLGVPIEECVVVENAPLGIESAKAAGAYCVAVLSTLSKEKLTGADEVIDEFKDLLTLDSIKKLLYEK